MSLSYNQYLGARKCCDIKTTGGPQGAQGATGRSIVGQTGTQGGTGATGKQGPRGGGADQGSA